MKTIHCVQHVPFEHAARIADWAEARDVRVGLVRPFAGEPLPTVTDVDALVLMGGPMGVHDEPRLPWLADEKRLIGAVIQAGRPVLGVCLGAQLIADVLGARVYRNRFREIGWHRIEGTGAGREHARFQFPAELPVYQWHGDTFDLPAGAVHLARSAACENQAFVWGDRVLGLQFHLEMTRAEIDSLIENCQHDIGSGPYVQPVHAMRATGEHFAAAHELLDRLLDRWKEASHEINRPEEAR